MLRRALSFDKTLVYGLVYDPRFSQLCPASDPQIYVFDPKICVFDPLVYSPDTFRQIIWIKKNLPSFSDLSTVNQDSLIHQQPAKERF